MATLLLFNIEDENKRIAIRLLSKKLGFSYRDIPLEQQDLKILDLLSGSEVVGKVAVPFTDEMMIISDFRSKDMHELLDTMRVNGCAVKIKAVVTNTNKLWTATRLHSELVAEERAFQKRSSRR